MKTLDEIALSHMADKGSWHHNYTPIYSHYFEPLRNNPLLFLEIGFGGYHHLDKGGAGARMWADYFEQAQIITTDVYEKNSLGHPRIHFYQGSQTDAAFLHTIVEKHGALDIICDDGSHNSPDIRATFEILFPLLKPGGIYVVEDLETSYWDAYGYGGGWHDGTSMNYFKRLTDHLNAEHNGLQPRPDIQAIHFWKQQVFVLKSK